MNCTGCGAPLPVDQLVCTFCGLHNAVDLLAIRDFKLQAEHSELTCPNGCGELRLLRLGGALDVTVGHCTSCNGLQFAPGALQIALDKVAGQVREINHGRLQQILAERVKPEVVRYKPCSRCRVMMNRRAYSQYIPVIVDECREHGVWLDNGEFSILAEWMEAGGRQHLEAEEQRRARVAAANGNVEPVRAPSEQERISDIGRNTPLPRSEMDDYYAAQFGQKKANPLGQNLPAWVVGLVLTVLLWFLLGLSWPVMLLAAGTAAGWYWRDRL
ncbi:hypothetical protein HQ393_12405 [Chitinibacter bivalviorum]|uniref:Uncharacterized protein n=1 Tax=Chitinibacter bivalviorum TaxID=2739434 RepID=A0A7H9BNR8_9NEIS|nr:hypothetical protein [Chitinibacter bivalviorum]QLG88974.1 hypothetical protein HQ393_12405 [Chitinibacter bivalviorum]